MALRQGADKLARLVAPGARLFATQTEVGVNPRCKKTPLDAPSLSTTSGGQRQTQQENQPTLPSPLLLFIRCWQCSFCCGKKDQTIAATKVYATLLHCIVSHQR